MLNRRIIRIKVFKEVFANTGRIDRKMDAIRKEYLDSCRKTRDLYYFMMNFAPMLKAVADERINAGLAKFNPSDTDLNPNRKFSENRVFALLSGDRNFSDYCARERLGWADNDILVRKIYNSVVESDYYREYMASGESSLEEDCRLIQRIYVEEFEDCEMLEELLERMSVMWMDDLGYVLNIIVGVLDDVASTGRFNHPVELFPSEAARDYGLKLLQRTLLDYERLAGEVAGNVTNWDKDRIVSTDLALIVQGLAEAEAFDDIPVKVTINEYVEISKYYSTAKSRVFVNGLLDRMIQARLASGQIVKSGRGLQDR